jgi:hypothetical protein
MLAASELSLMLDHGSGTFATWACRYDTDYKNLCVWTVSHGMLSVFCCLVARARPFSLAHVEGNHRSVQVQKQPAHYAMDYAITPGHPSLLQTQLVLVSHHQLFSSLLCGFVHCYHPWQQVLEPSASMMSVDMFVLEELGYLCCIELNLLVVYAVLVLSISALS